MNRYKKIKLKIKNNYLASDINDENMSFIYTFAKLLKIKEKSFIRSMRTFKGLPHRFEIFLKKNDTLFINDSKATSFIATQSALSSLKNIYWILGGLPKKGDKIKIFKFKKNISKCYIIGKNINFFKNQIENKLPYSVSNTLKILFIKFQKIVSHKEKSKIDFTESAAASFDQFNFEIEAIFLKTM